MRIAGAVRINRGELRYLVRVEGKPIEALCRR
jgi:hypothetical protein